MTYNGYKNYETWCVSLWLDNDEGNYNDVRQIARDCYMEYADPEAQFPLMEVEYRIEQEIQEYVEQLPEAEQVLEQASFVSDLLRSALSEVDWREIALNILSEIKDES